MKKENMKNYQLIADMMKERKVKGKPIEYVIIHDNAIIDAVLAYRAGTSTTEKNVLLVHKKDLHNHVPKDIAELFWHRKMGVRSIQYRNSVRYRLALDSCKVDK